MSTRAVATNTVHERLASYEQGQYTFWQILGI